MRLDSISQLYSIYKQYPLICTDSRNCPKDSVFFALKGDNFDANAFAAKALENGCAYAVIDKEEFEKDERYILVDDVLETLQRLATFHRRQLAMPIMGITGTNGKTTTKELIAAVLKEKYNILYTEGNYNNHIGVPLTLLRLKPEHELAVIEMGANHIGEIALLCEIARPDYGIITNVGKAHLEGFGSFENVMKTKAELYRYIARNGKLVFINDSNPYLNRMAEDAGLWTNNKKTLEYIVGKSDNAKITHGQITDALNFLEMNCSTNEGAFTVQTHLVGAYNAENVVAAIAIGNYFSVSNEEIKHGIENYIPKNNRSQFIETENNRLIVDAYNANPFSMRAAIDNFISMNVPDKYYILGDMRELGAESENEHAAIVNYLKERGIEHVLMVGNEFQKVNRVYPQFENADELKKYLRENPLTGNTILIKGSRGIRLEQIIECL